MTMPLRDPFDTMDTIRRPERVEDRVPRHGGNGTPKVWWPDNSRSSFYGRPSGWGKKGENTGNLERWKQRMWAKALVEMGDQSRALRAEWGALAEDDKAGRNQLIEKGIRLASVQDRIGTALHAMTERHDFGETFAVPDEYSADLEAWKRVTEHFQVVTMPSGRPGIEVFVALDHEIRDASGALEINEDDGQPFRPVRLAGTFDRLVRYLPCNLCGCRNYILDLKSGSVQFGQQTIAVQLGIYAGAKEYIPFADGGERFDLPDICRHLGIVINLPAGSGVAHAMWVNIAWGFRKAVDLMPRLMSYQYKKNLMVDFVPTPDVWLAVERAQTPEEVRNLFRQYPGEHWTANDHALTIAASARLEALGGVSKMEALRR